MRCPGCAVRWHLIGTLQRSKARLIAGRFALIHSVDRADLATEIARRVAPGSRQRVLLQVNCSAEPQKGGVEPDRLPRLIDDVLALPALELCGLMTMAAFDAERAGTAPHLRAAAPPARRGREARGRRCRSCRWACRGTFRSRSRKAPRWCDSARSCSGSAHDGTELPADAKRGAGTAVRHIVPGLRPDGSGIVPRPGRGQSSTACCANGSRSTSAPAMRRNSCGRSASGSGP